MSTWCVLPGGADDGAYQVGMGLALAQAGIRFDGFAGTSVGALNAAYMAQFGMAVQDQGWRGLDALWRAIRGPKDIYRSRFLAWPKVALGLTSSLYDTWPLAKLIEAHLRPHSMEMSGVALRVGVVSLITGNHLTYCESDGADIRAAVLASATIPLAFPPVDVCGSACVDAGLREQSPLAGAVEAGASEVYVLATKPFELDSKGWPVPVIARVESAAWKGASALTIAKRSLEIILAESLADDLKGTLLRNRLASEDWRRVRLHLLAPTEPPRGEGLEFKPSELAAKIEHGKLVGSRPAMWVLNGSLEGSA